MATAVFAKKLDFHKGQDPNAKQAFCYDEC